MMESLSAVLLAWSAADLGNAVDQAVTQYVPINSRDVEVRVEAIGASPLPYQAVRLRLTVRNLSGKRIGPPILPVDDSLGYTLIKGPSDPNFLEARPPVLLVGNDNGTTGITRRGHKNRVAPLFLDPGEQTSVSFTLADQWVAADAAPNHGRRLPIFLVPGEYSIRVRYLIDVEKRAYKEDSIKVQVGAAKGEDADAHDLIEKDLELATVLLRPGFPRDKHLVPRIKQLVERYPKSSYAHYGRLAVALAYRKGIGYGPPSYRVGQALAADELERVMYKRFAYQPAALVHLAEADPVYAASVRSRLHREHTDALEWLEGFAALLGPPGRNAEGLVGRKFPKDTKAAVAAVAEEWQAFRKQAPAPRKRDDVPP